MTVILLQIVMVSPGTHLVTSQLIWSKMLKLFITVSGADPGFFLGGGALVSCSTSTPINHIGFFL